MPANWPQLIRSLLATFMVILAFSYPTRSQDKLAEPTGKTILTIEGNISTTNGDGKARFDLAMLEQLGMTTIETTAPWYDGLVKFEGVPVQKVLDLVGAQGHEAVTVALNDYRTTIPMADFSEHGVILALKRDGQYMPVSDKGPIFIVYPYDSKPQLQSQQYYARSAWQLARLIVQ